MDDLFITIANHELRNALTAIRGSAQLLQRSLRKQSSPQLGEEAQHAIREKDLSYLDSILRRVNSMDFLISQLLTSASLERNAFALSPKASANVVELVRRCVEQFQHTESDYRFVLSLFQDSVLATYDEVWMEHVLENLLNNAVKYSPAATTITVGLQRGADEVVIWVRDEGCGIGEEHHAALFDQFYRARTVENEHVKGWGLGLYICQEVMRQHGGRIWFTSTVGVGSTFCVALPLRQYNEMNDGR